MSLFADIESAHETLYRHLRTQPHCDILIDRMAWGDLGETLDGWAHTGESAALRDPIFDAMPEQSPLLLRLPRTDLKLTEYLLERARTEALTAGSARSVCAFIFSPVSLPRMAKHLSAHLNANMEGFGSIYFRYFDPRVWPHLQRIITPTQLHGLFGDIDTWLSMDWHGRLQVSLRPPALETSEPVSPYSRPHYSAAQWQQIERIETVNLSLQRLQAAGIALPDLALADKTVAAAATQLESQIDQVAYSAFALALGATFTGRPQLPEALKLAREHDIPLADVIADRLHLALEPAATVEREDSRSHQSF